MSNAATSAQTNQSELCNIVMKFTAIMKRLVDQAKQPGFTIAHWAELAELVDMEKFERVGPFREVQTWREYTEFLTQWVTASTDWDSTFRRIHEWSNVVFLELEERSVFGDNVDVVRSVSVYEFNAARKIVHLDIYLQRKLPA